MVKKCDNQKLDEMESAAISMLAHILLSHQKLDDAKVIFELLCEIDNGNLHAHKALAYIYVETGQFDSAIFKIKKIRSMNVLDSSTTAIANLLEGRAYLGLGYEIDASLCLSAYRKELSKK